MFKGREVALLIELTTGCLRNYRKSIQQLRLSILGRLRDFQYIFAVIYEALSSLNATESREHLPSGIASSTSRSKPRSSEVGTGFDSAIVSAMVSNSSPVSLMPMPEQGFFFFPPGCSAKNILRPRVSDPGKNITDPNPT